MSDDVRRLSFSRSGVYRVHLTGRELRYVVDAVSRALVVLERRQNRSGGLSVAERARYTLLRELMDSLVERDVDE